MWLIEAVSDDGSSTLIGHHGIMPVRFSSGSLDLLFGKTENTMLRPEYRRKVLYPRFERRFASAYEGRFDALFSTMGDDTAIRQRRAMGYKFPANWLHIRLRTSPSAELVFLLRILQRKFRLQASTTASGLPASLPPLRALDDSSAGDEPFFQSFWSGCRAHYGVTPRRDREDLAWRFWSNPNTSHITLVSDSGEGVSGYVILSDDGGPEAASLRDIVPERPDAKSFRLLLQSALYWLSRQGIRWVDFSTTDDSVPASGLAGLLQSRQLRVLKAISKWRQQGPDAMPRKLTAAGQAKGIGIDDWYVTPIIFEGR